MNKKTKKRHRTTPTNNEQPPPQKQKISKEAATKDKTELPPPPQPQRTNNRQRTNSISEPQQRQRTYSITSHKVNSIDLSTSRPDQSYYIYLDATANNGPIDEKTPDSDIYQLLTQKKLKIGVIDRAYPPILIKELKNNTGTTFFRHDKVQLLDHEEFKQRTQIFYLNH